MEVCPYNFPTTFSIGVNISKVHRCHLLWVHRCHLLWVHRCHLLWEIRPEWRSQELLQKRLVSHELSLPFFFWCIFNWWIMVVLSKGYKPDNFESHNSPKLSFTNMRYLFEFCWMWIFLECTFPDILALCESWLSWFWQYVCERLFLFNPKGFCHSCAWCCSLCEARTSFCMGLISRKLYRFLLMFLTDFFFLYWSPFSSLYRVFVDISSNIDEVLSIKISANVFVFGEFNVYHKDWLT